MPAPQTPTPDPARVSHQALDILAHPATWAAMAALALNDLVLRRYWPSALTGKLGDFAWLFGFPLIVAAVLALAMPRGWRARRPWLPAALAFGFVGGIFALAKTIPACHALVVSIASALFGFPASWRRDPTDLVALLALAPAWWLWCHARRGVRPAARPGGSAARAGLAQRAYPLRYLGLLLIPLSGFLTMADAAAPRPIMGVTCVGADRGEVYAQTSYGYFRSTDGGMTWAPSTYEAAVPFIYPTEEAPAATATASAILTATVPLSGTAAVTGTVEAAGTVSQVSLGACGRSEAADPAHPDVMYRFEREQAIEMSQDGGATWRVIAEIPPMTADEKDAYAKAHYKQGGFENRGAAMAQFTDRPANLTVDAATGNAIFAMGLQGVLVRRPTGAWAWVAVGETRPINPPALAAR